MLSRLFQWVYYRVTGDAWSQVQRDIGVRPTLRWVVTGQEGDAARAGPTIYESIRDGMRTAERAHRHLQERPRW
ncbi:hypothetical protein [Sorangium sp. So ce1024]|uniref:hypothetical protein n=1 Tax=Sorangium sp. So ce1024 TaxID=3133327 RepID=UPI003EFFE4E8